MITHAEIDEWERAVDEYEDAVRAMNATARDCATAMGCTRPATADESRPVDLPKLQPPRLPTGVDGVDGEGVPPVYDVRSTERV